MVLAAETEHSAGEEFASGVNSAGLQYMESPDDDVGE